MATKKKHLLSGTFMARLIGADRNSSPKISYCTPSAVKQDKDVIVTHSVSVSVRVSSEPSFLESESTSLSANSTHVLVDWPEIMNIQIGLNQYLCYNKAIPTHNLQLNMSSQQLMSQLG